MKSYVALPLVLVAGLASGYWAGTRAAVAWSGRPAASAETVAPLPVAPRPPAAVPSVAPTGIPAGVGGPSVEALLAGFDRRKPVESNLRILQKILAATPEELAKVVRGMAGIWRNDPGWEQAKQAALQRWVEVAPEAAIAWAKTAQRQGVEPHEAASVFAVLAAIDPKRALSEARALASPMLQRQALHHVLEAMAQTDPRQALRMAEEMPAQLKQQAPFLVFMAWANRDPAGAAAGLAEIKDMGMRRQAIGAVAHRWAERDPQAAFAWIRGLPEPGQRMDVMRGLFGQMGARSPELALDLAAELPRHQQLQMQKELVGGWARTDPEAAREWVLSRTDPVEQQKMIVAAAAHFDWMAPDRAAAMLEKLPPGSARDNAVQNLVRSWAWSDPAGAREFAASLPEGERHRLHATMVEALTWRGDPDEAVAYLKENPIDDPAHPVWANLAGAMADQATPEKALAWARGLEDEATRLAALPEIFQRMATQDPGAAARAVLDLPAGSSREESLARVGGAWAGTDFEEALGWARGLTGRDRESALGSILNHGAWHQPAAAATHYAEWMNTLPAGEKPADSFITAASAIAGAYAAEDQNKAAAWVAGLPQDDARAAASRSLAEQWTQYDAPAASEWIGTLPAGKPRDQAVSALVNRIAGSDPATAFAWAATVGDERARADSLESTLNSWRKLDAAAARAAVDTADWPDAEKARWLEKLR